MRVFVVHWGAGSAPSQALIWLTWGQYDRAAAQERTADALVWAVALHELLVVKLAEQAGLPDTERPLTAGDLGAGLFEQLKGQLRPEVLNAQGRIRFLSLRDKLAVLRAPALGLENVDVFDAGDRRTVPNPGLAQVRDWRNLTLHQGRVPAEVKLTEVDRVVGHLLAAYPWKDPWARSWAADPDACPVSAAGLAQLAEGLQGWLGVPLHGLLFSALEQVSVVLSAQVHAAEVKGFRIGQTQWTDSAGGVELRFQMGILDDRLLDPLLSALTPSRDHGSAETTLKATVQTARITSQEAYGDLYARHAADVRGRDLHLSFLTPTTFRTTDLDMPFPVPKTVYYGLQRRWEAFSNLHFGPELNDWVGRAVRVREFRLRPRSVHFKGARGAAMTASLGEVHYQLARPGDAEPTFVRLLTEFANYAGVGYKTTFGLGHVEAWGWEERSAAHDASPADLADS